MIQVVSTSRGRGRILENALSLFAVRGFDRVTTRDIGRAAGISSPALYRHYPSKDALGLDLYRRCYSQMVELAHLACKAPTPLAKLEAYVTEQVALYEREPLTVLYVDEHQQRFWSQIKTEFEPNTLSALVSRWVAEGRHERSIDIAGDAQAQAALVLGLTSQWIAMRRQRLAPHSASAGLVQIIRRALVPS